MTKLVRMRRTAFLASLLTIAMLATGVEPAVAHAPHDFIYDVVLSPSFETDHTVFAISDLRPMRSTDGGKHWVQMVRGLTQLGIDTENTGQLPVRFAVSPADPRVVYLATRRGGVFRSNDQGVSWKSTNSLPAMVNATDIAVSASSADVLIAADPARPGLFRSDDGGHTWKESPGLGTLGVVTFVPAHTGRVVVGDVHGQLYLSDDDGVTFKRTGRSRDGAGITAVAIGSKEAGSTLFAGTNTGEVLRSDNAGASWSTVSVTIPDRQIESLALSIDFARDTTLWASTRNSGVYESTDAGKRWTLHSHGLTTNSQAYTVRFPEFTNLAVGPDSAGKHVLYLAGFDGLFESSDGGFRWAQLQTLSEYVTGIAVSPDYDHDGTVEVNSYVKGVYISRDHGQSFVASDNGLRQPQLDNGNEFLPLRRMHDVVFSPDYASDHTIFTATWDKFIRSTDGGRTWIGVLVAPEPPARILRQFVIAVSPDYSADHTVFLGTRQGDFYRSTKGGVAGSWSTAATLDSGVRSIVISPSFEKDRTLFASTANGVVTSGDGGSHWHATGPKGISLLAMSSNYASDGTVFSGTQSGLYVTRNRGKTWTTLTSALLSPSIKVVAIGLSPDFKNDKTMLVSVEGVGLFRSTDAGRTFSAVGASLLERSLVIEDFENPTSEPIQFSRTFATDHTVYAYGEQSVVRSTDGGDTWQVLDIPAAAKLLGLLKTLTTASRHTDNTGGGGSPVGPIAVVGGLVVAGGALVLYRRRSRARSSRHGARSGGRKEPSTLEP